MIERWALAHGESVVFEDRYIERNVAGAKRWQEREIGAVIEALRAGDASGIIVALGQIGSGDEQARVVAGAEALLLTAPPRLFPRSRAYGSPADG